MISVAKKSFPKAHDRNRIRRIVREGYRRNKQQLYSFLRQNHLQLAVVVIYTSKKITSFNDAENKIKVVLTELMNKAANNGS